MRIFSKKSFRFDDPSGGQPSVTVQAQAFATVPDWVVNSQMFKWASDDADIQIMTNAADVAEVEKGPDPQLKELQAAAKELKIQGYTKMGVDELTAAIEEAKKSQNPQT